MTNRPGILKGTLSGVSIAGMLLALGGSGGAMAQEDTSAQTKISGWQAKCSSTSRAEELTCTVEQGIYLAETNQQLAKVVLRVPADASKAEMVVQLPHGLYLPNGLQLQFDDQKAETHQVHTCDQSGCFVLIGSAARMVVAMKGGKSLKLSFKNLTQDEIAVTMPLDGFSETYKKAE